uniref:Uncharacterized protein n=1 Tax=Cacopsylla melanoneura TaxID=428564 RepID=A0A8D9F259_9HEMI
MLTVKIWPLYFFTDFMLPVSWVGLSPIFFTTSLVPPTPGSHISENHFIYYSVILVFTYKKKKLFNGLKKNPLSLTSSPTLNNFYKLLTQKIHNLTHSLLYITTLHSRSHYSLRFLPLQ